MNNSYLLKYAVKYLSKFDSSKQNVEKILKSKIMRLTKDKQQRYKLYSQIEKIINDLEKNKLINDENFTYNKICLLTSQAKSKIFIINYILQKGVEKKVVLEIFNNFDINNYDWEKKSALAFAKKKRLLGSNEDLKKKLGKMSRAGFPYQLCREILK